MRAQVILLISLLTTGAALAQSTAPTETTTAPDERAWEFSLSAYTYIVQDDRDYVQPTLTADRDWLHLEARYNYEDIDTGSIWVGCNFSFGDDITLELTPMLGGVFGNTEGIAPGYRAALSWWRLELYTEGEYVFDTNDSSDSFFYTWSELTVSPVDWLRVGLVIQRTKVYETDFDVQRGVLVGVMYRNLSFTTYVLNPDDDPTVVLGVGFEF